MRRAILVLLLVLVLACASPSPAPPVAPAPRRALPEALLRDARESRAAGDLDLARSRLEEAVADAPGWDLPRIELAELLVLEGRDPDRAALLLEAPIRSDNPRAYLVRGQVAELRGDDVAAAAAYAQSLLLRPDPDVRLRRALVLDRLGRAEEAIGELERLRAESPGDGPVRARLAELYERGGRLRDAESELVSAAEASPERAAGWQRLAAFYERSGDPRRAAGAEARARAAEGPARDLRPLLPSRR